MLEDGYIHLWRKIRLDDFWPKGKYSILEAWIDLIMSANYKDHFWSGILVKRGSLIIRHREQAKIWGWKKSKINWFLNKLKVGHKVEVVGNSQYTLLKILNYDKYNDINFEQIGHKSDTSRTQVGHVNPLSKEVRKKEYNTCNDLYIYQDKKKSDTCDKLEKWFKVFEYVKFPKKMAESICAKYSESEIKSAFNQVNYSDNPNPSELYRFLDYDKVKKRKKS